MPPVNRAALGLPPQSEDEFQADVVGLAKLLGWRVYHTRDSRGSDCGFPDLTMVRRGRLIFAELKTDTGKLRPEQEAWLSDLLETAAEVHLWRPSAWVEIERVLSSETP